LGRRLSRCLSSSNSSNCVAIAKFESIPIHRFESRRPSNENFVLPSLPRIRCRVWVRWGDGFDLDSWYGRVGSLQNLIQQKSVWRVCFAAHRTRYFDLAARAKMGRDRNRPDNAETGFATRTRIQSIARHGISRG
jgi:hypothetical protein